MNKFTLKSLIISISLHFIKIIEKVLNRIIIKLRPILMYFAQKFNIKSWFSKKIYFLFFWIPEAAKVVKIRISDEESFQIYTKRDHQAHNFFWCNLKEKDCTINIFCKIALKSHVIIDIGAYTGYYSVIAGKINNNCKIYAFEPVPEIHKRLKENIKINKLKNVIAENLAISNINRRVEISIPNFDSYFFTSEASLNKNFRKNTKDQKIHCTTLEYYANKKNLSNIDLIKIDIESEEPNALEGMKKILKNQNPILICEVLGKRSGEDLEKILSQFNYKYFLITNRGLKHKKKIIGDPNYRFLNYLFYNGNTKELQEIISPLKIS